MALTHQQARSFYDRFGRKQDAQGFYEDVALRELITHADFVHANSVFELGCGTGRFARELLTQHLSTQARYTGMDLSETMITLAQQRLISFGDRAKVIHTDGAIHYPIPDNSVDRVIATYVFDLLSAADSLAAIQEARRVLVPGGKLCLVSLTQGVNLASRLVCKIWNGLYRLNPNWVGGCHPIRLKSMFESTDWSIEYRQVVTQFGVPSEILIASPHKKN